MSDRQFFNVGIALTVITAIVLFIAKMRGADIQVISFIGLAVLAGLLFLSPLIGIVIIIPVALLAWFRYYQAVLDYINTFKGGK